MLRVLYVAFVLDFMTIVNEILKGHPSSSRKGPPHGRGTGTLGKQKSSVESNNFIGRNCMITFTQFVALSAITR